MRNFSRNLTSLLIVGLLFVAAIDSFADEQSGLRGDPAAIKDAQAMVEAMGGLDIWLDLEVVHFVHEWDIANRPDRYLEHEILDLTGPRSYVTMDSEIYSRTRAYSPEHGYWIILNVRKEPITWATTQYIYVFGPLARFGNLKVPNWATTNNGLVRYEMVSLTGSPQRPDLGLFAPPQDDVPGN